MNKLYERMAELMYETLTPKEIAVERARLFAQDVTKHASGVKQSKLKKMTPEKVQGVFSKMRLPGGDPKLPKTKK